MNELEKFSIHVLTKDKHQKLHEKSFQKTLSGTKTVSIMVRLG